MLNKEEGKNAVLLARTIVEQTVQNTKQKQPPPLQDVFNIHHGAFVTLHTHPRYDLRGCIGIPLPVMTLQQAIIEAASSVTHDPRFPPLAKQELSHIIIEVTILTPPEQILVDNPKKYPEHIEIGRDGLIVEQGFHKGLLLPQVPVEQQWDKEEFLSHTCMKAGLPLDAWFDKNTKLYKFSGQIFTEKLPSGDIEEKTIHGSNH